MALTRSPHLECECREVALPIGPGLRRAPQIGGAKQPATVLGDGEGHTSPLVRRLQQAVGFSFTDEADREGGNRFATEQHPKRQILAGCNPVGSFSGTISSARPTGSLQERSPAG